MDQYVIGLIVVAACLLLFLFRPNWKPLQWAGKGVIQLIIGAVFLFVFNIFAALFDLYLPLNLVTVAIAGFLGIPGVLALAVIKLFILT
jgi:inhibitor of the pro-sigma K processing machinery